MTATPFAIAIISETITDESAAWHQDPWTGDYDAETLVVRAADPRNLDRLASLYDRGKETH